MLAEYELERENDERLFVSANKDNECPPHFHRKLEVMYVLEGESFSKDKSGLWLDYYLAKNIGINVPQDRGDISIFGYKII